MKRMILLKLQLFILFLPIGFILVSDSCAGNALSSDAPVHVLSVHDFIKKWVILGPLPNHLQDEFHAQSGFDTDFLKNIGGESGAILKLNQSVSYKSSKGNEIPVQTRLSEADTTGIVDFEKWIGRLDFKTAYAFCYIYSDLEQQVTFLLGSDDGVKVWVNGTLVHKNDVARAVKIAEDKFSTILKKGMNRILVKVTQGVREWGFVIETLNPIGAQKYEQKQQVRNDFINFLNCSLVPANANRWNTFFTPGEFPRLEWENKYLVQKVFGEFPMKIRWFNSQLKEVERPSVPGRYAFYAEGITPDGTLLRRGKTLFCMPEDWNAWAERPKASVDRLPLSFIGRNTWIKYEDAIADYAGRILLLSVLDQKEGAEFMSFVYEMNMNGQAPGLLVTPIIRDQEYHLALKKKVLGTENKWPALNRPQKMAARSAVTLSEGDESDAGFKTGTVEKMRTVCDEWYRRSREPFVVLVARQGVIVFHEAFGERTDGKISLNTATEIASVTKLVTGLLFALFVDQGLIAIDDPVGKYLPDFPAQGDKVLTLRHCFTQTSGLWSHEEWGGMHNPWLDNVIANTLPILDIGKRYEYNGMGYNLAGKVMEIVSGKSIFRLMREHLFDPLQLKNTVLEEDLAFGCHSTAGDLAVLGQLLLNRGAYGDLKFFSPETFVSLMPQPLNKFYENISVEQGIGLTWMRQSYPYSEDDGNSADQTILSKNVIGHGSATSTVLRVDLDNGLVITQTRRSAGKFYEDSLVKFLAEIDKGIHP